MSTPPPIVPRVLFPNSSLNQGRNGPGGGGDETFSYSPSSQNVTPNENTSVNASAIRGQLSVKRNEAHGLKIKLEASEKLVQDLTEDNESLIRSNKELENQVLTLKKDRKEFTQKINKNEEINTEITTQIEEMQIKLSKFMNENDVLSKENKIYKKNNEEFRYKKDDWDNKRISYEKLMEEYQQKLLKNETELTAQRAENEGLQIKLTEFINKIDVVSKEKRNFQKEVKEVRNLFDDCNKQKNEFKNLFEENQQKIIERESELTLQKVQNEDLQLKLAEFVNENEVLCKEISVFQNEIKGYRLKEEEWDTQRIAHEKLIEENLQKIFENESELTIQKVQNEDLQLKLAEFVNENDVLCKENSVFQNEIKGYRLKEEEWDTQRIAHEKLIEEKQQKINENESELTAHEKLIEEKQHKIIEKDEQLTTQKVQNEDLQHKLAGFVDENDALLKEIGVFKNEIKGYRLKEEEWDSQRIVHEKLIEDIEQKIIEKESELTDQKIQNEHLQSNLTEFVNENEVLGIEISLFQNEIKVYRLKEEKWDFQRIAYENLIEKEQQKIIEKESELTAQKVQNEDLQHKLTEIVSEIDVLCKEISISQNEIKGYHLKEVEWDSQRIAHEKLIEENLQKIIEKDAQFTAQKVQNEDLQLKLADFVNENDVLCKENSIFQNQIKVYRLKEEKWDFQRIAYENLIEKEEQKIIEKDEQLTTQKVQNEELQLKLTEFGNENEVLGKEISAFQNEIKGYHLKEEEWESQRIAHEKLIEEKQQKIIENELELTAQKVQNEDLQLKLNEFVNENSVFQNEIKGYRLKEVEWDSQRIAHEKLIEENLQKIIENELELTAQKVQNEDLQLKLNEFVNENSVFQNEIKEYRLKEVEWDSQRIAHEKLIEENLQKIIEKDAQFTAQKVQNEDLQLKLADFVNENDVLCKEISAFQNEIKRYHLKVEEWDSQRIDHEKLIEEKQQKIIERESELAAHKVQNEDLQLKLADFVNENEVLCKENSIFQSEIKGYCLKEEEWDRQRIAHEKLIEENQQKIFENESELTAHKVQNEDLQLKLADFVNENEVLCKENDVFQNEIKGYRLKEEEWDRQRIAHEKLIEEKQQKIFEKESELTAHKVQNEDLQLKLADFVNENGVLCKENGVFQNEIKGYRLKEEEWDSQRIAHKKLIEENQQKVIEKESELTAQNNSNTKLFESQKIDYDQKIDELNETIKNLATQHKSEVDATKEKYAKKFQLLKDKIIEMSEKERQELKNKVVIIEKEFKCKSEETIQLQEQVENLKREKALARSGYIELNTKVYQLEQEILKMKQEKALSSSFRQANSISSNSLHENQYQRQYHLDSINNAQFDQNLSSSSLLQQDSFSRDNPRRYSNVSISSNISTSSGRLKAVPTGSGSIFTCADEEECNVDWKNVSEHKIKKEQPAHQSYAFENDYNFDSKNMEALKSGSFYNQTPLNLEERVNEIQRRNTLMAPHLRSCYPSEFQYGEVKSELVNEKSLKLMDQTSNRKMEKSLSGPVKRSDTFVVPLERQSDSRLTSLGNSRNASAAVYSNQPQPLPHFPTHMKNQQQQQDGKSKTMIKTPKKTDSSQSQKDSKDRRKSFFNIF